MDATDLSYRLAIALAIGLLVGVERHWQEPDAAPGHRTAGIRTFGLTGLLGGLAGAVGGTHGATLDLPGAILIGASFLGFSAAFLIFRLQEARAAGTVSVTSVIAGQATFLLGALAVRGDPAVVGAAAVVMTVIPALCVAAAIQAGAVPFLIRRAVPTAAAHQTTTSARNPFELTSILQLAGLLALVELLAKAGQSWLGEGGVLAVAANTLCKVTIAAGLGGTGFTIAYGVPVLLALLAASAVFVI